MVNSIFPGKLYSDVGNELVERLRRLQNQLSSSYVPGVDEFRLGAQRPGDHRPARAESALEAMFVSAGQELRDARVEATGRARLSFLLLLGFSSLAFVALVVLAVLASLSVTSAAVITGIGAAVSSLVSGLFYRVYRAEMTRADDLLGDLRSVAEAELRYRVLYAGYDIAQIDCIISTRTEEGSHEEKHTSCERPHSGDESARTRLGDAES